MTRQPSSPSFYRLPLAIFLKTAISLWLIVAVLFGSVANAWQVGWVTHESKASATEIALLQPQIANNLRTSNLLTEAQHRLLHEIADHHASAILSGVTQLHPQPLSPTRPITFIARIRTTAIAPPLRPPRPTPFIAS